MFCIRLVLQSTGECFWLILFQIKKHKKNKKKSKGDGDMEFNDVERDELEMRKEISEKKLQREDTKKGKGIGIKDFIISLSTVFDSVF